MWHNGDYRIIFRHEHFPSKERVVDALESMWEEGQVLCLKRDEEGNPIFSSGAIDGVQVVSVAVLQKRITDGEFSAWSTLGVGYSLCQWDDRFCKGRGRRDAFIRATIQVPHGAQKAFIEAYESNTNPKYSMEAAEEAVEAAMKAIGALNEPQAIEPR